MRTNRSRRILVFAGLTLMAVNFSGHVARAQDTTRQIPYRGHLEMNGVPQSGSFDFILTIEDASSLSLWSEEFTSVEVAAGRFSVTLGQDSAGNPLLDSVWQNDELYLTIQVKAAGDQTYVQLSGRQRILSVPYAARAETAKNYRVTGQLDVDGKITTNNDLGVAGATQTGSLTVSSDATVEGALAVNSNATVDGQLSATANASVGGNLTVSGRIIGPQLVAGSGWGLGPARANCPLGKRVIWAMGWTNDNHSPCDEKNRDNRCSKPIFLSGCAGRDYCEYTGSAAGCNSAGYSCVYALCQ